MNETKNLNHSEWNYVKDPGQNPGKFEWLTRTGTGTNNPILPGWPGWPWTRIAQNCQSQSITALVLAGALNKLRWTKTISLDRPVPPITIAGLPLDTEYADDVDVNDEEQENLGAILPQATAILEKWNLFVNEDKTDFTHAYLSSMGEVDSDGNL